MKGSFGRKLRFLSAICLAFAAILSLFSCTYSDKIIPCEDIVRAVAENEIGLPAGKIYSASASEGEDGYIPDSLLSSLFGEGAHIPIFESWLDIAFFMPSSAHPCEIVAILCDTPTAAKDTARLLCHRLNAIKNVKSSLEYASYLDSAEVTVSRNYVLLIISSDTATAKKIAVSMIN